MKVNCIVLLLSILALSVGCVSRDDRAEDGPSGARDLQCLINTINIPIDAENGASYLYDFFLDLVAGGEIDSGTLFTIDERFLIQSETYTTFHWDYYITPNELRGFNISIPTKFLDRSEENYTANVPLVVDTISQKQNIKIIVMKQK